MSKKALTETEVIPQYVGWYQPHKPVNWDGLVADPKTGEMVLEPSMTKQSHKDECDINNIIKSYQVTGMVTHINERAAQGTYADLPDPLDYQEALNISLAAQASFDTLPSKVRERFDNDPEKFLQFMHDERNTEEIYELGLATRPKAAEPVSQPDPVPPVNPQE